MNIKEQHLEIIELAVKVQAHYEMMDIAIDPVIEVTIRKQIKAINDNIVNKLKEVSSKNYCAVTNMDNHIATLKAYGLSDDSIYNVDAFQKLYTAEPLNIKPIQSLVQELLGRLDTSAMEMMRDIIMTMWLMEDSDVVITVRNMIIAEVHNTRKAFNVKG